jgi:hypothetical protein
VIALARQSGTGRPLKTFRLYCTWEFDAHPYGILAASIMQELNMYSEIVKTSSREVDRVILAGLANIHALTVEFCHKDRTYKESFGISFTRKCHVTTCIK